MLEDEIIENLFKLSDKKYSEFSKKLCTETNREIIGVRIPKLRTLAKEIAKKEIWKEYIERALEENLEYFEEVILQGLVIGYAKIELEEKFEYIKKFIPKIDAWEITDTFIPTLKFKEDDLEKVWEFILPYSMSNEEFEVRFAVVVMLDYFINEKYVDKVIKVIDEIENNKYYAEMAMAWTIAEIGVKFQDKALAYLKSENNLTKFTYNKSLQKMIESFRIDDETKKLLRRMKRK